MTSEQQKVKMHVWENLKNEIKDGTDIFNNNNNNNKNEFQLLIVFEEVVKETSCLSINRNVGMNQTPTKSLNRVAGVSAYPLAKIINRSVKLSAFQKECNIAKLKPLFTKGRKTDPQNHIDISLLLVVSKIIAKSMHFQLEDYLKKTRTRQISVRF